MVFQLQVSIVRMGSSTFDLVMPYFVEVLMWCVPMVQKASLGRGRSFQ